MRLGKTTLVHFASQVGVSIAGFVATFAIARLLGADGLGTYVTAVALLFWLNVPANAVSQAITKRVSEGVDPGSYLSAGVAVNAAIAVVLAGTILALSGYVNDFVGAPVSALVAGLVVANVAFLSVVGVLNGRKRVAQAGVLRAVERVLRTGAQVGLVLAGYEVAGLLFGHAASLAVGALVGAVVLGLRPSAPSREHLARVGAYARYSWLGALKARAFGWMDTIVLAFFVPSALIGIYEVSWTLASTLVLVSVSVQRTLFPELSELSTDENYERIHHYLEEGLVFTGLFAIPGFFGALVLGPRLLRIYRPEFTQGATVLLVLIAARTVAAFGSQFLSAINAVDRPDVAFRVNLAFVVANLLLNVTLVWRFGWYGAAVATALSAALSLGLGYLALTSLIDRPTVPYRSILAELGSGVVMAVAVAAVEPLASGSHYATVALVLVGVAVYTGVLLAVSTRVRQKAWALVPKPA